MSDCLAFEVSNLHSWLESGSMKQDGENDWLVLFSDNAYLNTAYTDASFSDDC